MLRNSLLVLFIVIAAASSGCYLSHGRDDADPPPGPPPMLCPAESPEPMARFEVIEAHDMHFAPGTRGAVLMFFRLTDARTDLETAEYPYRFTATRGSLTAPDGGAVFTNLRLIVSERRTNFGPDDVVAGSRETAEGELWDSNLLRAGSEFTFSLTADVSPGASGVYEVRLGDDCDLSPRFWFVPEDGPTIEMPISLIAGNSPLTVRITVEPSP